MHLEANWNGTYLCVFSLGVNRITFKKNEASSDREAGIKDHKNNIWNGSPIEINSKKNLSTGSKQNLPAGERNEGRNRWNKL